MIRLAIFSDTHGTIKHIFSAVQSTGPYDYLVHLGDGVVDGRETAASAGVPFIGVCGNEDPGDEYPEKYIFEPGGFRFLFTHGNSYGINAYMSAGAMEEKYSGMVFAAGVEGVDAFFFGHTHRAVLLEKNGIIICNPGDQYSGSSFRPSFAEVEISTEGFTVSIMRLGPDDTWQAELSIFSGRSV